MFSLSSDENEKHAPAETSKLLHFFHFSIFSGMFKIKKNHFSCECPKKGSKKIVGKISIFFGEVVSATKDVNY